MRQKSFVPDAAKSVDARLRVVILVFLVQVSSGFSATWFVAPTGADGNSGTSNSPFATVTRAQTAASSGDTIYVRGGNYFLSNSNITATNSSGPYNIVNNLTKSGVSYLAYPGERPVFDFSNVQPVTNRVTAFLVSASDCVFKGFDVVGVQVTIHAGEANNTQSECFRVAGGNRNRFEQLAMHDGMGIGWYLTSGQSNLVLNCDAYNNRGLDSLSIGNVDGFGAHPGSTSGTGNMFHGCRAWFNSDDGFDLINAKARVVIEDCWSFYNGYFTNFASSGGDGNGFKAGGYGRNGSTPPNPVPRHVTRFCLAVRNRVNGFYANHHTGGLDWFNNTAYANNVNYNMQCTLIDNLTDVPGYDQLMKNNLGYQGAKETNNLDVTQCDVSFNYFTLNVTVAANDFQSFDESLLTLPRQANGDLPYLAFAQLVSSSDLANAGTNSGFVYAGTAPDLGAFEYGLSPPPTLVLQRGGSNLIFTSSGGPAGGTNYLVAASELSIPASLWVRVATNKFDLAGNSAATNAIPVAAQQLYRLSLP
jgi:Pel9A-like, right handed beta helix region